MPYYVLSIHFEKLHGRQMIFNFQYVENFILRTKLECVLNGGINLFQVEIEADSEKNAMKGKGEDSC
jgi:hypothetical protein